MVIGHPHADSVAVLREMEPGVFEPGDEPAAFPMKAVVSAAARTDSPLMVVWTPWRHRR
jgi:hypothetical protein